MLKIYARIKKTTKLHLFTALPPYKIYKLGCWEIMSKEEVRNQKTKNIDEELRQKKQV